jgi:hypothetical protein
LGNFRWQGGNRSTGRENEKRSRKKSSCIH